LLLQLLAQNPPVQLRGASVQEQLTWAIAHWQPEKLKKMSAIRSTID
jgi:glutamyl-Q tRNA(Asp) synthetase